MRPKRKTPKPYLTLQVGHEDQEKLRAIAHSLGFRIPSGKNAGQGSISALIGAIAQQQKIKLVKNMAIDGNPTYIYFENGLLTFSAISAETGENNPLATKEQYQTGDRCEGSIFESLQTEENIKLLDGYFILDEQLDLVQDWQIV
jgi:hypothetical protein